MTESVTKPVTLESLKEKFDTMSIDFGHLAAKVRTGTELSSQDYRRLAGYIDLEDLAEEMSISSYDVAQSISCAEVAAELEIYASDVASEIDVADVASEIDVADVADEIDVADVADAIDFDQLVESVVDLINLKKLVDDAVKAATTKAAT